MGIVVQKFGGTSVGSVERIQHVAQLVQKEVKRGNKPVVVVSAMGKSTDQLVDMAEQITANPSEREMDMLLTTGEQVTIALLSMALHECGQKTVSLTGWQAGIQTEEIHGNSRILNIDPQHILKHTDQEEVVIVAGFQGVSVGNQITTLGRGGSDTTAVALAAALKADRCEIYTDVTGVYTADPRVVPKAKQLDQISCDEMLELANLGAGVLHPRAVENAKNHQVPLVVRSSFEEKEGTLVKEEANMEDGIAVHGVAHDEDLTKVTVRNMKNEVGALYSVFSKLAEAHINVDVIINQSLPGQHTTTISFSVNESDFNRTLDVLTKHKDQLQYEDILHVDGLAKVSIVGAGMISNPGVAAQMFGSLSKAGVDIKMVSTSEIKVSCIVRQEDMEKAVRTLHTAFGLDRSEE